jgi:hypothetical protein
LEKESGANSNVVIARLDLANQARSTPRADRENYGCRRRDEENDCTILNDSKMYCDVSSSAFLRFESYQAALIHDRERRPHAGRALGGKSGPVMAMAWMPSFSSEEMIVTVSPGLCRDAAAVSLMTWTWR